MFKKTIELIQHTPLIHFQHGQAGATLRATEVKAKLDRYLWKKEWSDNFVNGKTHLIGYDPSKPDKLKAKYGTGFRALNYRLNIQGTGEPEIWSIPDKYPLYFGNMQSEEDQKAEKHFSFWKKPLQVTLHSFNQELLIIIGKHAGQFFYSENFGTRQGKGFGSFKVLKIDGENPKLLKPSRYTFELQFGNPNQPGTHLKLFKAIDLFYRTLRSGINLKGRDQVDQMYFKSLLFQYARREEHTWDKREIRRELFGSHPNFQRVEQNRSDREGTVHYRGKTPSLYRDMLGLSSSQSWLSYGKAQVNKTSSQVDRFKSPILFKPVYLGEEKWRVYIILNDIPDLMKGRTFSISSGRNSLELTTPSTFDLENYLRFAFGYFKNNAISVEEYVGNHNASREVAILEKIYSQLGQQI